MLSHGRLDRVVGHIVQKVVSQVLVEFQQCLPVRVFDESDAGKACLMVALTRAPVTMTSTSRVIISGSDALHAQADRRNWEEKTSAAARRCRGGCRSAAFLFYG